MVGPGRDPSIRYDGSQSHVNRYDETIARWLAGFRALSAA